MLQPLKILQWKWEGVDINFVSSLPRTRSEFDAVWVIVDQLTKSVRKDYLDVRGYAKDVCAGSAGKLRLLHTVDGVCIQQQLSFSPTTRIGRAIKTKKLHPRYIGPFEVLRRVEPVDYQVALPPYLSKLHDVFHVSQLHKYTPDATHVLELESVELKENLTFQVTPVKVDDTSVKTLHRKEVLLVKVAWRRFGMKEHTWELDSEMQKDYPKLFSSKS
ncbi:uncharacterized protein [Arachis hypogaea]|uniref:uncharacterized protein n=1 Tax=Arachis hypogaea TaxID=3818 RepID=UPI003B20CB0E